MYWKITADYLYDGEYIVDNRTDMEHGRRDESEPLLQVKLYDDDDELYYMALAEDSALEDLYEWTMRDAGVTKLFVKDPQTKKWEHTI